MSVTSASAIPAASQPSRQAELVRLDAIRKSYGHHVVLDDVNLKLKTGEVMAIIGPSGSGKSTLLRCVNLLERATSGRVTLAGVDGRGGQAHAPARTWCSFAGPSAWCSSPSTCSRI